MAVSTVDAGVVRLGDNVTTEFSFNFKVSRAEDIRVANLVEQSIVPLDPGQYSVMLNPGNVGGEVTLTSAPLLGDRIYIYRETNLEQLVEVSSQTKYDPVVVEGVWDKLTLIAQELNAKAERAVKTVPGENPDLLINAISASVVSAQGAASQAAASESAAAASAAAADADAAQASADRVQTSLDAAATAADRIQTGLDRTQTGLDANATAADRTQTGLDAAATAADRIQTGLDRTQTGLDAAATAADRVQTGLDRDAAAASAASIETSRLVPTGAVSYFAMNAAPTGWLKANGALVSRATYADLFAAIGETFGAGDGSTTFALPDLRGEFLRGWDDGRGVDSGRGFGSAQGDQNKAHTHGGATNSAGDHTHQLEMYRASLQSGGSQGARFVNNTGTWATSPGWFAYPNGTTNGDLRIANGGDHTHSISSDGGTEARPRNVALLACIKF